MLSMSSKAVELTLTEERLVHVMSLLGDRTRYRMYKLLLSDSEMCVSEIAESLGISPSAVSQHFRSFEMLGLVNKDRTGQKICYSLKSGDDLVFQLNNVITSSKALINQKESTHA